MDWNDCGVEFQNESLQQRLTATWGTEGLEGGRECRDLGNESSTKDSALCQRFGG